MLSKFELKAIEIEVLETVYTDVQRYIDWEFEIDENGEKQQPTNERAQYKITVLKEIVAMLEKKL